MDILGYLKGKLSDFENTVAQKAQPLGQDFSNFGSAVHNEFNQLPSQIGQGFQQAGNQPLFGINNPTPFKIPQLPSPTLNQGIQLGQNEVQDVAHGITDPQGQGANYNPKGTGLGLMAAQYLGGLGGFGAGGTVAQGGKLAINVGKGLLTGAGLTAGMAATQKIAGQQPTLGSLAPVAILGTALGTLGVKENPEELNQAINLAKGLSKEDFVSALSKASKPVQDAVQGVIKDKSSPVNSVEDFHNAVNTQTPPVANAGVSDTGKTGISNIKPLDQAVDAYKQSGYGTDTGTLDNLVKQSETPEAKSFTQQQIKTIPTNPDGTISVYRVGGTREGTLSVTTNSQMADIISKERIKQGLDGTISQHNINPNDIKLTIPGFEKELLIDGKSLNQSSLPHPTEVSSLSQPQNVSNIVKEGSGGVLPIKEPIITKFNDNLVKQGIPVKSESQVKDLPTIQSDFEKEMDALASKPLENTPITKTPYARGDLLPIAGKAKAEANIPIPKNTQVNPNFGQEHLEMPLKREYMPVDLSKDIPNPKVKFAGQGGVGDILHQNLRPQLNILRDSNDPAARTLAARIDDFESQKSLFANNWLTDMENATKGLGKKEWENIFDINEHGAAPLSPEVARAAEVVKGINADIRTKGIASNLHVLDAGSLTPFTGRENYMPHFLEKDALEKAQGNKDILSELIKNGKATNEQEARLYLERNYNELAARRQGNLEFHRGEIEYPYMKTKEAYSTYLNQVSNRLASANQFGTFGQESERLIQDMTGKGNTYEAKEARDLISKINGKAEVTPEDKLFKKFTSTARFAETTTKMGLLTPWHHGTAIAALASRVGNFNTLKSTGALLKAVLGNYSELARRNVSRLHSTDTSLYGGGSKLDKFYSAIGLNRTLKALSAMAAHAANYRLDDMTKDLANPTVQRDIERAGLDYQQVLKQGGFTPLDRTHYIQSIMKDTSLLLHPGELPKIANTQIGKIAIMLKAPILQRTERLFPYLIQEVLHGNIAPAAAFIIMGTAIGSAEQVGGNIVQNAPAKSPQTLLLQGLLRGVAPFGGQELASLIQYPQFTPQTIAGMVAGPVGSDVVTGGQAISQLQSNNPQDQLTAKRALVRNIPIIGPTLANTVLPYKSYVGNRPSDIVSSIVSGKTPIGQGLKDIVRQNPDVQAKQQVASTYYNTINNFEKNLSTPEQDGLKEYANIKAQLQLNPNDEGLKIARARLLASDPKLLANVTQESQLVAKATGSQINPLLTYDSGQQKILLNALSLPPTDAFAKQLKADNPELFNDYYAKEATYSAYLAKQNIQPKAGSQAYLPAPQPSQFDPKGQSGYVQNILDQAAKAKAAGQRTSGYYNDSSVQAFLTANREHQNQQLTQLGYNQVDKYGNIIPAAKLAQITASGGTAATTSGGGGMSPVAKYLAKKTGRNMPLVHGSRKGSKIKVLKGRSTKLIKVAKAKPLKYVLNPIKIARKAKVKFKIARTPTYLKIANPKTKKLKLG